MDLMLDESPRCRRDAARIVETLSPEISISFGQTVIYGRQPMPEVVQRLVDANEDLEHPMSGPPLSIDTASSELLRRRRAARSLY